MYLIISSLSVQGANAMSGPHAIGYPALTSFLGLANAICRAVPQPDNYLIRTRRLAIVHHESVMRRYGKYGQLLTHKRSVYQDASTKSPDSPMWFTPASELQPQIDLTFSLIIDTGLTVEDADRLTTAYPQLENFIPPRALGGVVADLPSFTISDTPEGHVKAGWFIVDETHRLEDETAPDEHPIERMYDLMLKPDENNRRYYPMQTGYRAISPLGRRAGQQCAETDHAFVEAVTGLARFAPRHEILKTDENFQSAFWTPSIDRTTGLFILAGDAK